MAHRGLHLERLPAGDQYLLVDTSAFSDPRTYDAEWIQDDDPLLNTILTDVGGSLSVQ